MFVFLSSLFCWIGGVGAWEFAIKILVGSGSGGFWFLLGGHVSPHHMLITGFKSFGCFLLEKSKPRADFLG